MMMYMTIFMGVMFFKVPAGLCIYFITSSIWSLVERHMVKKFTPPAEAALGAAASGATGSKPVAARESVSKKFDPAKIKSTKPPEKLSDVLPWLAKTKADRGVQVRRFGGLGWLRAFFRRGDLCRTEWSVREDFLPPERFCGAKESEIMG
jgi:hypothetical protein